MIKDLLRNIIILIIFASISKNVFAEEVSDIANYSDELLVSDHANLNYLDEINMQNSTFVLVDNKIVTSPIEVNGSAGDVKVMLIEK